MKQSETKTELFCSQDIDAKPAIAKMLRVGHCFLLMVPGLMYTCAYVNDIEHCFWEYNVWWTMAQMHCPCPLHARLVVGQLMLCHIDYSWENCIITVYRLVAFSHLPVHLDLVMIALGSNAHYSVSLSSPPREYQLKLISPSTPSCASMQNKTKSHIA